ncbi:hypothetical protein KEM60_02985 [Austwickia sp. TVS 96-490-7B]|nr:hypothetical protein [Austwickia sp. TVS 96-490-7B]
MTSSTFADFSLPDSCIHRIFLPLVGAREVGGAGGEPVSWHSLARIRGVELDAGTQFLDLFEPQYNESFSPAVIPAEGRATEGIINAIRHVFGWLEVPLDAWDFAPYDAPGSHVELSHVDVFFREWLLGPMPGALRYRNSIMLDAPRYSDSVVLSTPVDVTKVGSKFGLEIVRASATRPAPPAWR